MPSPGNDLRSPTQNEGTAGRQHTRRGRQPTRRGRRRVGENRETDSENETGVSRQRRGRRNREGSRSRGRRGARGSARRRGGISRGRGRQDRGRRACIQSSGDTQVQWRIVDNTQDTEQQSLHFTAVSGSKLTLTHDSKPYEFYTHFLGDDFLAMIIAGTNTYAEQKIEGLRRSGRLTRGSRWNHWRPVTTDEMRAVMAIIINMGIMSIPVLEAYWKTSWECYIPFFHDVMGRNRFQEIFWNLHIPQPAGSTRRVDKVGMLLDHIRTKSQAAFYPGKEVAVDETMVGFRGRVSFKQYCPKKPTKYGLKFFVLADTLQKMFVNITIIYYFEYIYFGYFEIIPF